MLKNFIDISKLQKIHSSRMKIEKIYDLLNLIGFEKSYSIGFEKSYLEYNINRYFLRNYEIYYTASDNSFACVDREKNIVNYFSQYDYQDLHNSLVKKFSMELRKYKIKNILNHE